jgi:type II secretory pathway pseudopilin PulG
MNKPRSLLCRLSRRLRLSAQEGSLLIEVMIGAVMVVVISGAVLNGLSGAQDTGERNKARTESAALAQQDQERMRAMPVDDLSNFRDTRNVNVAGVNYTVESRSDWVRDANGIVSCINDQSQAQYMKITSTVNSEISKNAPLTQASLVSPPRGTFSTTSGTAAVQVIDRDQNPLPNVRVDISGPQSLSDVTNDLGCVVFGFIPEGPWTLEISSLGLVGWDGTSPYKSDIGVVGGATVLKKIELDQPSSIVAAFDTKLGAAVPVPAKSKSISVANSHLPSPGWKAFNQATSNLTVRADGLYPFADGYGVYAGTCEANNPAKYDSDYFSTVGTQAFVITPPGGTSTVLVRKPAINVEVQNSAGAKLPGARVKVTTSDANCTETYPVQNSDALGALPEPGFPFGSYNVCADDGAFHRAEKAVVNTNPDGTSTVTLRLPSLVNGNCP